MRIRSLLFALSIMLISCQSESASRNAYVDIAVPKDTATIGDLVPVSIEIYDPEGRSAFLLGVESGEDWEYRELIEKPGMNNTLKIDLSIVFWDTGNFMIPPLSVGLLNQGGDTLVMTTDSTKIFIQSVLTSDENSIKPIKGPVPLKWSLSRNLLLLILACLLTAFLIWIILKKRIKSAGQINKTIAKPVISDPVKHALDRLFELKKKSSLNPKERYFTLTHILREFMEGLFFVRTLEMTTSEIVSNRNLLNRINDTDFETLKNLLLLADGVKFARHDTDSIQFESDLEFVVTFVSNFGDQDQDKT